MKRYEIKIPGLDIFEGCQKEIQKENREAIHLLAFVGVPLGLGHMLIQAFIAGKGIGIESAWLLIYFLAMTVWDRFFLPEHPGRFILLIYLAEAPLMFMAILSGTVLDPNNPAVTIMLFMMIMPMFIFDRADRVWTVLTGWLVLFVIMATLTKPGNIATIDYYHILDFYIASLAVTFVMLHVRYTSVKNMVKATFLLTHDEVTGARNRQALDLESAGYLQQDIVLVYADMDQLTAINDMYGHTDGDRALKKVSEVLFDAFGEAHVYRAGGDEFICVKTGGGEDFVRGLDRIRERLHIRTEQNNLLHLSCALGYVIGKPEDRAQFANMLHLAEVFAHKATARGKDQSDGGLYSDELLRREIVENTSAHAQAFERNQLTGLPAMSYFVDKAQEVLDTEAELGKRPVIGYFNLAGFKAFNEKYGYAAGDDLIRYTGSLLKQAFAGRMLCHITGDQFGIAAYRPEVDAAMKMINGRLMNYRQNARIYAKAGFIPYKKGDTVIADLDKASVACRSIRNMQGKTLRYYDQQFDDEQRFRQYILDQVDEAAEGGRLKVYYQPIVHAPSGLIYAQEALVRWSDPTYGLMPPGQFIPVLEENRMMHKVDLFMVRQVLEDFKKKREKNWPVVPVSVNFSRYDFEQCDLVTEVNTLVEASGFDKDLIKVEVTESAFVKNQDFLMGEIQRFRDAGFPVWMDDFGSGYSSLNLLEELPFNLLKIDMEFMKHFVTSERNRIIVEDIIRMVNRLGMRALTEGVETRQQFELLRDMGCEYIQGYYFGKPQPLEAIMAGTPREMFRGDYTYSFRETQG